MYFEEALKQYRDNKDIVKAIRFANEECSFELTFDFKEKTVSNHILNGTYLDYNSTVSFMSVLPTINLFEDNWEIIK